MIEIIGDIQGAKTEGNYIELLDGKTMINFFSWRSMCAWLAHYENVKFEMANIPSDSDKIFLGKKKENAT
jgi:hypothetical protein